MYRLEAKGHDGIRLSESIDDILSQTKFLSMATVKNSQPWINTACFAYDNSLSLYILTYPNAVHSKNVVINDGVAITVFDSRQNGKLKQGLQLLGKCKQINGDQANHGLELWGKRIIGDDGFDKFMTDVKTWSVKIYELTINWVKIFDEKRYGVETWIEAKVVR